MPEPTTPRFNLIDTPWLTALDLDGHQVELSLLDAFRSSGEVRELTGEVPTQVFANLRLLLAILHRAVGSPDLSGPTKVQEWQEIRDQWDAAVDRVAAYLDRFRDRFWLVHPTAPFFQVADLASSRGEVKEPGAIVADGPGNSAYLTTRLGDSLGRLSWPEAARWLVHAQTYDVSGIHTGAVGDPRVKGGKGYPIGPGWAGQIGGVHLLPAPERETLRETLLLNLVVPSYAGLDLPSREHPDQKDLPPWERPPLTARPEGWPETGTDYAYREPNGPVDLYTWQARRIRLVGDEDQVIGVVNAQGDRATPQFRRHLEPMTAWRYSDPQTTKHKQVVYMPLEPTPGRALWRGLEALIPHLDPRTNKRGQAERKQPGLMTWAHELERNGLITGSLVRVRAIGATYVNNQSAIGAMTDDTLTLPTSLLAEDAAGLTQLAVDSVDRADKGARQLGYLARNLALAGGASSDLAEGYGTRATESGYAALDRPFRDWLRDLAADRDEEAADTQWQVQAAEVLRQVSVELVGTAGPASIVGRVVNGQHLDGGRAEQAFRAGLRKLLPLAHPRTTSSTETESPPNDVDPAAVPSGEDAE
jgi:CRISPR system Cascade subunit CasA